MIVVNFMYFTIAAWFLQFVIRNKCASWSGAAPLNKIYPLKRLGLITFLL
jgi:hypothetical protein